MCKLRCRVNGCALVDDAQARLARVVAKSARWRAVEHLEVTDSTNAVVASRARAGAASGLVVVADHQTAGRGRSGRRWEDRPGGSLLVSCLVVATSRPTLVPLAAGLAVADVIADAGAEPELKWPNDVLIAGRKCAGVLVEALPPPQRLVIGIGVNTDWRGEIRADAPAAWTSLAEELDRDVDRWDVLVDLLGSLESRLAVVDHDPEALLGAYASTCATIGQDVVVNTPGGVIAGRAVDVDEQGRLIIRTGDRMASVDAGDVTHLRQGLQGR